MIESVIRICWFNAYWMWSSILIPTVLVSSLPWWWWWWWHFIFYFFEYCDWYSFFISGTIKWVVFWIFLESCVLMTFKREQRSGTLNQSTEHSTRLIKKIENICSRLAFVICYGYLHLSNFCWPGQCVFCLKLVPLYRHTTR